MKKIIENLVRETWKKVVEQDNVLRIDYCDGTAKRIFRDYLFRNVIVTYSYDDCGREDMDAEYNVNLGKFTPDFLNSLLNDGSIRSWDMED
jgi:hypothetical protein